MRQRSSYPKLFKAQVVQECLQPGATISSVAIHHGINANVCQHRAVREECPDCAGKRQAAEPPRPSDGTGAAAPPC